MNELKEQLVKKLSARKIAHTPLGDTEILNAELIVNDLMQLIEVYTAKREQKIADNALTIAEYWLEEDGRGKHLIQDLWDVRDISVLEHIPKKYVYMYRGYSARQDAQLSSQLKESL